MLGKPTLGRGLDGFQLSDQWRPDRTVKATRHSHAHPAEHCGT
jgi:hypothetical protein